MTTYSSNQGRANAIDTGCYDSFSSMDKVIMTYFSDEYADDDIVQSVHIYAQLHCSQSMYFQLKPFIECSRSDFNNFRATVSKGELRFDQAKDWFYRRVCDAMCKASAIQEEEIFRELIRNRTRRRDSFVELAPSDAESHVSHDSDESEYRFAAIQRRKKRKAKKRRVQVQSGRVVVLPSKKKTNTREYAHNQRVKEAIKDFPSTTFSSPRKSPGQKERDAKRALRDMAQRVAAADAAKRAKQAIPKRVREAAIKRARDKRNVVLQGGRILDVGVKVALVGMGALFARFLKKAGDASATANDIMSALTDMAVKISKLVGKALWCVPLLLGFYFAIRQHKTIPIGFSILLSGGLARLIGKDLWGYVSSFFCQDSVQLQSGSFQDNASKLLSTIMVFSIFGKKFSHSTVGEFGKRMAALPRLADGWSVFMDWALNSVEMLINYVRKLYGQEAIAIYEKRNVLLTEWAKKVDHEYVKANTSGFEVDNATLDLYVDLAIEGSAFKDTYRGTPMMRTVEDTLSRIINLIRPHQGALCARNNFRVEPEMCVISGAPGIGKTAMTLPFCFAIMMQSGMVPDYDESKLLNNVWQKGNSEFWNGYARQLCVIMDDAFQARADATDKDNEFMNIIRMISSWSMPLNFADLESKGKIYFLSQFVLATTNQKSVFHDANLCLHEPGAVVRRMGHSYRIELEDEFKDENGFMDWNKFHEECRRCKDNDALDVHPWYMWVAYKQDLATGVTSTEPISLRDIIIDIAAALRMKRASHLSAKEHLGNMVAAFKRSDAPPVKDNYRVVTVTYDSDHVAHEEEEGVIYNSDTGYYRPDEGPAPEYDYHTCQAGRFLRPHVGAAKSLYKDMIEYKNMVSFVSKWLLGLGICGILAVAAKCVGTLVKDFMKAAFGLVAGFFNFGRGGNKSVEKKGVPRLQSNRPVSKPYVKVKTTDVRLQSGDPFVAKKVYSATYKVVLHLAEGGVFILGQVMFVNDTLCLQPQHFSDTVRRHVEEQSCTFYSKMKFINATTPSFSFERDVQEYLGFARISDPDRDVEFLRFTNVRAHANVTKNFITESQLNYMSGQDCRLDVCEVDDRVNLTPDSTRMAYIVKIGSRTSTMHFAGRRLTRYFYYDAPTTPGDCGAPLCLLDNTLFSGKTAIGIHVAGDKARNLGFSAMVTQEMIENARVRLDIVDDRFEEDLLNRNVQFQSGATLPFEPGSFLPIGKVAKGPNLCPKSSYYKTKLYECFGPYAYKPSILGEVTRNGETVYPMVNALKPYSTPVFFHDAAPLERAAHVALKPLFNNTKECSRVIFSFDEAVLGVPSMKFRSVPRNTAPGFPYCLEVSSGKKEYFGFGEEYDLTGPKALELRARVADIIDNAKKGVRLSHIFVDFLKDELRTEAKVEAVATRLISSAPMDYTIAFRQYFGAFTVAVMTKNIECGMAPGICTFTDWTALSNKLQSKGSKVFAGDFKSFDSSLQPTLMRILLDMVNKWYDDGEENARIRSVLWLELMHSRHIGGLGRDQTYVYQWNKALPSGHPFTTFCNSQSSLIYLTRCFEMCTGDSIGFWTKVYTCTMGDDNANNTADSVVEQFNQVTVAEAMRAYNLVYTSDIKGNELVPFTNLAGITFLKRRFLLDGGHWNCPLEFESFMYTVYWCRNKKMEKETLISVLENALEELSLHEKCTWDMYAPRVYEVLSELCITPNLPCSRDAYLNLVRSRADNWY